MSEQSTETTSAHQGWDAIRASLMKQEPAFYELEPGGALMMDVGRDGWLLELTPDGRLLCQMGMAIEDVNSLMSEGTPEDLGTDEVAKQAKYYLQPAVSKYRATLRGAGFQETTEMNEEYVATTFQKIVDFQNLGEVTQTVQWCRQQFGN